ncbi:MAG: FAD-dependent pyridine nucleotide-disulfide oxidoreductase [Acidimicrobiales bacterium]|nr:FAD-dependent pyridine nucleotide-disulfide oxidoreductase [Acidimicrobiales bacterium]
MTKTPMPEPSATSARVIILGTGFAGLAMASQLKRAGQHDFLVLERARSVGGTWRDNTYPGCACDVPSLLYSFSFAQNPEWSDTFSPQPEIRTYLEDVASREGILPHCRFGHVVREARWDDTEQVWHVETSQGSYTADVVVSGVGGLSEPKTPELPGIDSFDGTAFHSATWDHHHQLAGERVAVIGTGASAIQFVPAIAPEVGHLTLFQRTPPWVMERRSRPISRVERFLFRHVPGAQSLARAAIYWARELSVFGFAKNPKILKRAERFARAHLHAQVKDPELRRKLTPSYTMGCKRILLSNDYYPALTRPNVTVETSGIAEVRAHSILTTDGTEHPVDTIIFGTGFQATEMPAAQFIFGTGGVRLADQWAQSSVSAYLGTSVHNFPNLFFIVGPNTGLGHTSMVFMIESQVAYILGALSALEQSGAAALEVRADVEAAYNDEIQHQLAPTVWNTGGCSSWYLDDKGRNTLLWPTFTFTFRQRTRHFDPRHYTTLPARRPTPEVRPQPERLPVAAAAD